MKNSKRSTKRKKNFVQKQPKAKSPQQRKEALARAADLNAINWIDDPRERLKAQCAFERTYISPEILAQEPALQQTAWVGYRYMHSLDRTRLFAHEYIAAYRRACVPLDPSSAPRKRPIKSNLAQNERGIITSLYKARQKADRLGMPYDLFLDILMQGKVVGDKHRQPPLPCQLLSGRHSLARLRGRPTRDEVAARLFQEDWDERFFAERNADDPVQAAAMRELRIDVMRADDRPGRLAKYLSIAGLLSEAHARDLFDGPLVDEALARSPLMQEASTDYAPAGYVPACFGRRAVARDSPCAACPVTAACKSFRASVTGSLIKLVGSGNPVKEHKRLVERIRQRRKRANDRAERERSTAG